MSKKALIIGSLLVVGAGTAFAASHYGGKISAADKLKLEFGKLQVKKASWSDGILFDVILNASNPSGSELNFTGPYTQIFVQDGSGNFGQIAVSDNAKNQVKLKPRETTPVTVSLRMTASQALRLPSFAGYIIKKYLGFNPSPSRKIMVEYSTKAEGFDISGKTDVTL